MTESLDDLFSFLEDDGLTIPGVKSRAFPLGKTYTVASPDAETGAQLAGLAQIAVKVNRKVEVTERDIARLHLSDEQEREFAEKVLGATLAEMQADGVSWVRIQRIVQYAYTHFAFSPQAAEDAARKGVFSGKAPARNRAERRGKKRKTGGGQ